MRRSPLTLHEARSPASAPCLTLTAVDAQRPVHMTTQHSPPQRLAPNAKSSSPTTVATDRNQVAGRVANTHTKYAFSPILAVVRQLRIPAELRAFRRGRRLFAARSKSIGAWGSTSAPGLGTPGEDRLPRCDER